MLSSLTSLKRLDRTPLNILSLFDQLPNITRIQKRSCRVFNGKALLIFPKLLKSSRMNLRNARHIRWKWRLFIYSQKDCSSFKIHSFLNKSFFSTNFYVEIEGQTLSTFFRRPRVLASSPYSIVVIVSHL